MAKRGPQSELTDRNWDQEDEPEEAGVFKQAADEVMQQRRIKRAKRRAPEEGTGQKSSPFGAFTGLVTARPDLKTAGEKVAPIKFGVSSEPTKVGFFSGATSSADPEETSKSDSKDSSYMQSIKSLNESVLAWIKQHVEKNPYIILSPVFKDYEKYLVTIESKKSSIKSVTPADTSVSNSKMADAASKPTSNSLLNSKATDEVNSKTDEKDKVEASGSTKSSLFAFGSSSSPSSSSTSNGGGFKIASANANPFPGGFSFGSSTPASSTSATPGGFSFAQSVKNGTSTKAPGVSASSGFSFGNVGGSSSSSVFGSLAAAAATAKSNEDEEEEYVPPKPEVKEIKEQDAVYTKRCKLFYKRDDQWADRGLGNLHLKAVQDNKTQIVVRADTNLGNILLNIMLVESLPMSRQGKNNVLIVCSPNPPLKEGDKDPKPVPMLVRVKTEADADELMAKLEERKKLLS